ncbi:MAG TPA: DUF433 domain-containing protein [Blastocatellia bacterium]
MGCVNREVKTNKEEIIEVDPEKMGETPVFKGTRVPIQNFFDCLASGEAVKEFLDQFPTVEREQVVGLFALMKEQFGLVEELDNENTETDS